MPGRVVFQVAAVSIDRTFRVDADQADEESQSVVLLKGKGSHGLELLYLRLFIAEPHEAFTSETSLDRQIWD